MRDVLLSDQQWSHIEPLLPKRSSKGRPWADNRPVLEGILWILKTGARWKDLPDKYPSPSTCWRRLRLWEEDGTWLKIWRQFLSELDRRRVWTGVSRSWMAVSLQPKRGRLRRKNQEGQRDKVDGGGRRPRYSFGSPIGVGQPGGSDAGGKHAAQNISAAKGGGRPKTRPLRVVADKGYDSDPLRWRLLQRGIVLICPHRHGRKKPSLNDGRELRRYRKPWKVERTFGETSAACWFATTMTLNPTKPFSTSHAWQSRSATYETASNVLFITFFPQQLFALRRFFSPPSINIPQTIRPLARNCHVPSFLGSQSGYLKTPERGFPGVRRKRNHHEAKMRNVSRLWGAYFPLYPTDALCLIKKTVATKKLNKMFLNVSFLAGFGLAATASGNDHGHMMQRAAANHFELRGNSCCAMDASRKAAIAANETIAGGKARAATLRKPTFGRPGIDVAHAPRPITAGKDPDLELKWRENARRKFELAPLK